MYFFTNDITSGSNWRGFERAVARLMLHIGWRNINLIGGSGDQGGDILGTRFDRNTGCVQSWVVQCKAITGNKYIGVSAINEAIHAVSEYNAEIAAVATNGEFTNSAKARQKSLIAGGFDTKLWNGRFLSELLSRANSNPVGMRSLRDYQQRIADKAIAMYDNNVKRCMFVVATGLGKTVIASYIARNLWERGCRRILVLCHATDLALQLEQGFWPQLSKDIPTSVFFNGLPPRDSEGISFGLFQSLSGYLYGIEPDRFDAIIVDEAHHALAYGFRTCLETLTPKFLLGMTATPWRGDGKQLSELFGSPIDKVSLVDGMAMGYLAKVDYRIFCDNVDWEHLSEISKKKISIRDLNRRLFLPQRDDAVITEIKKVADTINRPRIAVFSPSLEHCERFSKMLCNNGIPCTSLSCSDKIERRRRLLAFSSGSYSAITAVDVMNEGIDIPDVNILVFLRATHSRRIFVQQLGRGLRISDDKDKVVVLDFVSDIRRMADVVDLDNEGKLKGEKYQVLFLEQGIVTFSNEKVSDFVHMWLNDVADLGDENDDATLTFPEGF